MMSDVSLWDRQTCHPIPVPRHLCSHPFELMQIVDIDSKYYKGLFNNYVRVEGCICKKMCKYFVPLSPFCVYDFSGNGVWKVLAK